MIGQEAFIEGPLVFFFKMFFVDGRSGLLAKGPLPFNGTRNIVIELESPFLLTSNFLLHLSIPEHQLVTQKLLFVLN